MESALAQEVELALAQEAELALVQELAQEQELVQVQAPGPVLEYSE